MPGESNRDQSIERLLKTTLSESLSGPGAACVDAEAMAAWAEGALPPAEAAAIEAHVSSCARCQELVAVFARMEPAAAVAVPFWNRTYAGWIAPLTAAAAAVLIWVAVPRQQPVDSPSQTMVGRGDEAGRRPGEQTMARAEEAAPLEGDAPLGGAMNPAAAPIVAPFSLEQRVQMAPPAPAPSEAAKATGSVAVTAEARGEAVTAGRLAPAEARPFPQATGQIAPTSADASAVQAQSGERSFTISSANPPTIVASSGPRPFPAASAAPPPLAPAAPPNPETAQRSDVARRLGGAGQNNVMMDGISAIDAAVGTTVAALGSSLRWRILQGGRLERSTNSGAAWAPVVFEPPVFITGAAAPAELVCWLVGRQGVVMRTSDGARFTRLTFPENVDLIAVSALDALQATVTTADGRRFTTADAGASWRLVGQ